MSTKVRVTEEPGTPVVAPRNKVWPSSDGDDDKQLSPVQRMRGKFSIQDPDIIRRIIYDPSLES